MTPEERERLRLTLAGMVSTAWQKYPKARAGDLMDLWRQAVEKADKRRRAKVNQERRRQVRTVEGPGPVRVSEGGNHDTSG